MLIDWILLGAATPGNDLVSSHHSNSRSSIDSMASNRTDFFLNQQQIQIQNLNRASSGAQQQFHRPLWSPSSPHSRSRSRPTSPVGIPESVRNSVLTVDSTFSAAPSFSTITISGTNGLHELEEEQELELQQEQEQGQRDKHRRDQQDAVEEFGESAEQLRL